MPPPKRWGKNSYGASSLNSKRAPLAPPGSPPEKGGRSLPKPVANGGSSTQRPFLSGEVGGVVGLFFRPAGLFQHLLWYSPGTRFFASGKDAAEKTGGENVITTAVFLKNRRAGLKIFRCDFIGTRARGPQML